MLLLAFLAPLWASDLPAEYTIGPGDTLSVIVHGHEGSFGSQSYYVGGEGEVSFPYIGKVRVGGLTPFQAEERFRTKLKDGYIHDPEVSVTVQEFKSQRVDVLGAVKKPGVYPINGPTTIRALLALAGGIDAAQSTGFVMIRRSGETTRLPLSQLEAEEGNYMLQGGDVIDVDQGTNVFLSGEVSKPGAIKFTDGLTVSQALILAGGETQYGRLRGSYIVREGERISVNLKRILTGKDADVALRPGDRVVVPTSAL